MAPNSADASTNQRSIHFFFADRAIARNLRSWDPDLEPSTFSSGIGHNLYELARRIEARNRLVTLGPRIPRKARVVVSYFNSEGRLAEFLGALRSARYPLVVIRSDAPLEWDPLFSPDVVVVPNQSAIWRERYGASGRVVLAMPQRGVIPRDINRRDVTRICFKGNPENVPEYLRSADFLRALDRREVSLDVDVPSTTGGSDHHWNDFHDIDAALLIRQSHATPEALIHKPPTRLINAWNAGVIPLVSPEPGYTDLLEDGVDAFLVRSPGDILAAIDRLKSRPDLVTAAFRASRRRGVEYSTERIVDQWLALLDQVRGSPYAIGPSTRRRLLAAHSFLRAAWPVAVSRLAGGRPAGSPDGSWPC